MRKNPPQGPIRNKKTNSPKCFITTDFIFILAQGLAYTAYLVYGSRHHETTDNAYVTGNQIMVTCHKFQAR